MNYSLINQPYKTHLAMRLKRGVISIVCWLFLISCYAQADDALNYRLAPGDTIRVKVFQHENLTLDTSISESGNIVYPLIGSISLTGLSLASAGNKIATALEEGGFVKSPQVNIMLTQVRGNRVSVLGHVQHPGQFPLETFNVRITDIIAMAGGILSTGSDTLVVTGIRNQKPFRAEVDFPALFLERSEGKNIFILPGDVIYVDRAEQFYIYGAVQKPGAYRLERHLTLLQALTLGGGPNLRGSQRGIKIQRKNERGETKKIAASLEDEIKPNDVIYVRERFF